MFSGHKSGLPTTLMPTPITINLCVKRRDPVKNRGIGGCSGCDGRHNHRWCSS